MTPEKQNDHPMTSDPALASASGSDAPYCMQCGKTMRFNVPRMGAAGGYVHAETGSLRCDHKFQIIARYGETQRGCETSALRGVWAAAEHELCHGADEVRIVVNRNYKHQNVQR